MVSALLIAAELQALDEADLLFDLESIQADDVSEVSPWYGSVHTDAFFGIAKNSEKDRLLRSQVALDLGWQDTLTSKLYGKIEIGYLADSTSFTEAYTNDETHWEILKGDIFLDWRANSQFSLKAGSQTFSLSSANSVRVLDYFVPMDNRVTGFGDINQLKLSLTGIDFSYQNQQWSQRLIWLLEKRPDRAYHDGIFRRNTAATDSSNLYSGGLYQLGRQGNLYDFQAVIGRAYNPALKFDEQGGYFQTENFVGGAFGFTRKSARYMAEAKVFSADSTTMDAASGTEGYQALLGVMYTGISNVQVVVEGLRSREDGNITDQLYASVQHSSLRDALTLTFTGTYLISYDAVITNVSAQYDWSDSFNSSIGLMNYATFAHDSALNSLENADNLYISASYFW